jgi:hypothetical protein
MHQPARLTFIGLWLLLAAIAIAVCSLTWPSAHMAHEYLPVGVDSFYHARRILDTAADPASFYEFDNKIHAPEGSLLNWPWGYDYAMGWLLRLAGLVGIPGPPIALLIWIPVAAVPISIGLIVVIARRLSLSAWSTVIAGLCAALSPLTQFLHGVGMIDHHFAEYLFVLASIAFGLKWFLNPHSVNAATALGLVLGIAPAVHNGLFILQLPLLITLFAFWLQDIRLPRRSATYFCATLILGTVAILIPSLPFRLGRFEFYTLSWFHLYVACGTAISVLLLAWLKMTGRNLALLLVAAVALLAPLGRQVVLAQSFLAGTIARLDRIIEMESVLKMASEPRGLVDVSMIYSFLIWLAPFSIAYCAFKGWTERRSGRLFFWVCCVLGLPLLLTQYRLHYFGSYALFLPWLVMVEDLAWRNLDRRKQVMLVASLAFLMMYILPIRYQLTSFAEPAADPNFRALRPILGDLQKACAADPGIVLADNDAGHYIRYYTDCSVIANNFLLTKQHEEKIRQIDYLTSLSAKDLPVAAPYVRYILLRPVTIGVLKDQFRYVAYSEQPVQLIADLLLKPIDQVPPGYVLIEQANMSVSGQAQTVPYIRLYKVLPPQ